MPTAIASRVARRIGQRRFLRDRAGTATIMTAFASTAVLGFMAIGVDAAHFYVVRRHLQVATDMAAMAAAARPDSAATIASSTMAANGFPNAVLQVSPGTYVADPNLSPAARFSAGATSNAVEVIATTREAFIFGSALGSLVTSAHAADNDAAAATGFAIRTRAVAARQDLAALSLGSGVAALDAGLLNAVLGALLGTRLSFSILDYQTLASATVDLFDFSDKLAAQGLITGPTYGSTSTSAVTQSKLLNALADAAQASTPASSTLRMMSIAVPPGPTLNLGKLIDFGPAGSVRIGATHPLTTRISAFDALMAAALLGGQDHVASVDLGATIPGLVSAKMMLALGEPAVGTSLLTVGPIGSSLHTAQARLLFTAQIGGSGLPSTLTVPFYLELAPASASLSAIDCSMGAANASVGVAVQSGLADLWIGTVSASEFGSITTTPTVQGATLADVAGSLRINAIAHFTPTASPSTSITFAAADIRAGAKKTVASDVSLDDAMNSLVGNTQVTVATAGSALSSPATPQSVRSALRSALIPVDGSIARTLSLLGLSLGRASVSVPGVRCGQGLLVN